MNNTCRTDFENMRIPQLKDNHRKITRQVEELQAKMAKDMGRVASLDILPRNFSILPIECCSLHDQRLLVKLTDQRFDCFWTLERKLAEENGTLEEYYAKFKFYSYLNTLTDDGKRELFDKVEAFCNQHMDSNKIIRCIMDAPNFLEEVMV